MRKTPPIGFMLAWVVVACAPRVMVVEPVVAELAAIDSLMWQRPDGEGRKCMRKVVKE